MEFGFTEEQEKYRKEIHDFYMEELPENLDSAPDVVATQESIDFWMGLQMKASGEKGYTVAHWPKKYGGPGLSPIMYGICEEETAYFKVKYPNWQSFRIHGPDILLFGTEEQKEKFLPMIRSGEVRMFNAETEPEAGSETANLQLRAVKDGDYYILNGQKRFISGAYKPAYLKTYVRTADVVPKHRGISIFVIPADTPGITFRPLPGLIGSMQHEIFFDDVRVHKDCLLGEENRGFYQAMAAFEFERGGTSAYGGAKRNLEEFVQFCKEQKRNGKPLIEDPECRKIVAQRAVQVEVMKLSCWRSVWQSMNREKLGSPGATINNAHYSKVFAEWWGKAAADFFYLYCQLKKDSKHAKLFGRVGERWASTRSEHGGGTTEIYKYIVANRGFNLPRWERPRIKAGEKVTAEHR